MIERVSLPLKNSITKLDDKTDEIKVQQLQTGDIFDEASD